MKQAWYVFILLILKHIKLTLKLPINFHYHNYFILKFDKLTILTTGFGFGIPTAWCL